MRNLEDLTFIFENGFFELFIKHTKRFIYIDKSCKNLRPHRHEGQNLGMSIED